MALSVVLSRELALYVGSQGSEISPALSDADWTSGTGWSYGTGTIEKTINGTGTVTPDSQTISAGKTYKVIFNIESISGANINWTLGGASGSAIAQKGQITQFIKATGTGKLILTPSATALRCVITGISVKEITLETIAFAKDFNLEINKASVDITTLAGNGWKEYLVDVKDWKVSFSSLVTRGTAGTAQYSSDMFLNSLVTSMAELVAVVKSAVTLDNYVIGTCYLGSYKQSGQIGDASTFSGEILGTSVLSVLTN